MEIKTTCSGYGSAGNLYDLRLVYSVSGSSVNVAVYLRRNDGYASSFYNLDAVVNCYVACGGNTQSIKRSVDTRNGKEVLLKSYTFTGLSSGTWSIAGGFSNTGASQLTGGYVSTSVQVITATPPTSAWFSKVEADTSYMNYSFVKSATDGHHNYGQGRIKLTCASSGATGEAVKYRIAYRIQKDGESWVYSNDLPSDTCSYSFCFGKAAGDSYFAEGTEVHFEVRALNSAGGTSYASSTCITANKKPTTPSDVSYVTAIKGQNAVVNWNGSTSAAGLAITYQYSTNVNGGGWTDYKDVSQTSVTLNTSSYNHGDKIGFKVRAKDAWGLVSAETSSSCAVQLLSPPNTPSVWFDKETEPIEGPITIFADASSPNPAGDIYYEYAYKFTSTDWIYPAATMNANFYVPTTRYRGETLYVSVRAKNNAGYSSWSQNKTKVINSAPTTPGSIWCTETCPLNTAVIKWNASTDKDGQQITYTVSRSMDNVYWNNVGTTEGTTYNVDIRDITYGNKFYVKVVAQDTLGAMSGECKSGAITKFPLPTIPQITSSNEMVESSYRLSWNASTFTSGNSGRYIVEVSWGSNGQWQTYTTTNNTYAVIDMTGAARGSVTSLKVVAVDMTIPEGIRSDMAGVGGTSKVIQVTRNRLPSPITNLQPTGGAFDSRLDFTWDKCTDPDQGQTVTYNLYMSKDGQPYSLLKDKIAKTSYSWARPYADRYNCQYKFKLEAEDSLGGKVSKETSNFYMPNYPTDPSNLKPVGGTIGQLKDTFSISWTASNFDGQVGEYEVILYVNDAKYTTIKLAGTSSKAPATEYIFDIRSFEGGSKMYYTVCAINSLGMKSNVVRMTSNVYKKEKPSPPTVIYPIPYSTLNSKNQRFVILPGKGSEKDNVSITIQCQGKTYNSISNSSLFSRTVTSTGDVAVMFRCPDLFTGTKSVMQFWTNDGYSNSDGVSAEYNVVAPIEKVDRYGIIYANDMKTIYNALNTQSQSYGLSALDFKAPKTGDYIEKSIVQKYVNAAYALEECICKNVSEKTFKVNISTSISNYVTADDINKVVKVLNSEK